MRTSEFTVPLTPKAAGRPRFTRRGIAYYGKADAEYRKALDAFFEELEATPLAAPFSLDIHFVLPRYKVSTYPIPRADLDNLMKAIMDAMTRAGKFWEDDHEVIEINATKEFGDYPQTQVTLKEVTYGN